MILREFESGRAHICLMYTLKLSHLDCAPHCVFSTAHLCKDIALQALDKCIASGHQHPALRRFQTDEMKLLIDRWRNGEDLFSEDLRELA
eukprot:12324618-Karenia_brevis.AAC.1